MSIRPATVEDAAGMARVQVDSWRAGYAGIVPQPYLDAISLEERTAVAAAYLGGRGIAFLGSWVAVLDDAVIGFASWSISRDPDAASGTAELASCYVDPDAWRSGAGRRVLAPGVDHAAREGFHTATLWVLADNDRGRSFYESTGWTADGASKTEDIGGASLEELRYRRPLT